MLQFIDKTALAYTAILGIIQELVRSTSSHTKAYSLTNDRN